MIVGGKHGLTPEGTRVLKMLVEKYGMQEAHAVQLLRDGGLTLAMVLVPLTMR